MKKIKLAAVVVALMLMYACKKERAAVNPHPAQIKAIMDGPQDSTDIGGSGEEGGGPKLPPHG